ncbi:hypothetical protein QF026_000597 [Streptomyces aurantiacus]|uniref:DUF4913 domain-containing protein n=1 Tax=Streptomyces aurantiacus TaxID=47760 RepID=UPI00279078C8|nr:DUF4913 domain-containing protein [Streptomyces aurantiacus]MDQ0772131.1 hypothetical protein [Streptomyces aurantiacus]
MSTETPEASRTEPGAAPAGEADGKAESAAPQGKPGEEKPPDPPQFILYQEGPQYAQTLRQLTLWAHHVLLPVYGREITSTAPWCSRWWEHPEAVAQLHGLWLAWAQLTGPGSETVGPANWHRDYLATVMNSLRDPMGPFAGCKPGAHRPKETPPVDAVDPFGPPPGPA